MSIFTEEEACTPEPLSETDFNPSASLPYELAVGHIRSAMSDLIAFLALINRELHARRMLRLESLLMPANFSSIVGEFIAAALPQYCQSLTRNRYHNGHPDLIPRGVFEGDAVQHSRSGIEVKASRYRRGWQGHNPENVWLLVFVFSSNRPRDHAPRPFRFEMVVGARLDESDWRFAGRSASSRRTITASVTDTGYQKMMANWIYRNSGVEQIK